ncbi:3-oxoacyl-[acyl-carrier-protein] reductase FabG [Vibrio aerogenes CECT 7868]|uniref:3-oxoacyl-[acyl-carrier-protein] reductase FabG n=1 Tax=Vibrio aerogenes CECT 7868 TaxID=1216006 RepID=A0A1M6EEZ7_9VIBR|nr:SDR family oxidoreductase [Vibrio aerogenes]SHI84044.1 3-oxoacyl-[acyl-carrier-protein] reductase FabG [Vibrio aerogenes CECT 7868]
MNAYTLVTGGTSGIGFAAAEKLIEEGRQVIITGQNRARLEAAAEKLGCMGVVANSGDTDSVRALAKQLRDDNIRLNGLVLNAGVFIPAGFEETTEASYDETFAVNTKGPFFTLQALLPCLENPCAVVFVSTIAVDKGFTGCASYAASKAAAEAFVRVANIELAPRGIRINVLRPGVTATPIQDKAGISDSDKQALFNHMETMALGRVLTASDHAGTISYLLSDASIAMRHAVIQVDGGYVL